MNIITLMKAHVLEDAPLALETRTEKLGADCEALDWAVRTEAGPFHGVVRLVLDLPPEFTSPWFMVPGFIYGENRRSDQELLRGKRWPRFDPALPVPREMASAWWDFGADRTSSPLVYLHQDGRCLALAAEPHPLLAGKILSEDSEPQLGIGFGHDGKKGYIRISFPACDEPFAYDNGPDLKPAVRRMLMPAGSSVSGRIYLYKFDGERHGYQRVMEHFDGVMREKYQAAAAPSLVPLVSDALHGITVGHYHDKGNYFVYSRCYDAVAEQIANARGTTLEWYQDMVGFVGGLMVCRALLGGASITGDERAQEVACRVAARICREGISPSGLFWADYVPAVVDTPNITFPNPMAKDRGAYGSGWLSTPTWVHSRTIADACGHLAAMIRLRREAGVEAPAEWAEALNKNLWTALDLQLENGSYGQYYDAVRRKVVKEDGCGGLLWIPALLSALELRIGAESLRARIIPSVMRAGAAYAPYVEREYIWGAPEDNDSPTSEDGMNAVMAYCDLYAATKERRWLELARTAADWMLTFRKTFNQKLPENTLMGRYGMKSRGGDFASVSNNHLHVFEVLCTSHLCRLSDWTGNPYYRQRALDHWGFVCQYLCRCDGMFNGFRGAMSEQFYWTDWGSWGGSYRLPPHHKQKGNVAAFSAVWCIAVIPIAAPDVLREFGDG